ncbi:hypothetical protein JY96_19810 [Aquabacterium sp. NJ1]|uniref:hypothetical protein n=1 Tax=Aquabacterium sp. NJ1 TaxID=1538295 RepID=UPI00052C11D4|nr:hypothetical protein [Aquabacterium sp. NJ1]KGM41543.1 hypothetical protein JY96_19810 [Aquabacterium sp. NJ1]
MQKALSFRSIAVATALVAAGASAHANLTIPANSLVANSVQAFSQESLDAFEVGGVTVTPLGNATAVDGVAGAFSFPITSITINNQLKIASGDAKGSALEISRIARNVGKVGVTVANFTINYTTKQVLADTTPLGGTTTKQAPLYNFNVATPLGIKYKFPLTITGHEVLDQLTLTPEMNATMKSALALTPVLAAALDSITTFGTLTQDILVKLRAKPVSTTLYVPQ